MSAELLHISELDLIVGAIRQCYLSEENSDSCFIQSYDLNRSNSYSTMEYKLGKKDEALIRRIVESGHESTLEHSLITFKIKISRGCLQELSRHRVGVSPSVQSTRYTLKKILLADDMSQFIFKSGNQILDSMNESRLKQLKAILESDPDIKNDVLKYGIPEALLIEEIISFNWRSFRHFLSLRLSPRAHFEIRALANEMLQQVPVRYNVLYEGLVNEV